MEDSHAVELNLDGQSDESQSNTFFAVYDGHGGMCDSISMLDVTERFGPLKVLLLQNTPGNTYTSG